MATSLWGDVAAAILLACAALAIVTGLGRTVLGIGEGTQECLVGKDKLYGGLLAGGCLDRWHLSHAILWTVVGLLSPGHHGAALGISVAWELAEHVTLKMNGKCNTAVCGRVEDVVINVTFYTLGSFLAGRACCPAPPQALNTC